MVDGKPQVMKDPDIAFIDDKGGKPVGIERNIGKRPIFVAGNSDGDLAMLQWSTAGDGPRFGMIVHHTDAAREWAYDRDSHIGQLSAALDAGSGGGLAGGGHGEGLGDDLSRPSASSLVILMACQSTGCSVSRNPALPASPAGPGRRWSVGRSGFPVRRSWSAP